MVLITILSSGPSLSQQTCSARDAIHLEGVRAATGVHRQLFRGAGPLPTRHRPGTNTAKLLLTVADVITYKGFDAGFRVLKEFNLNHNLTSVVLTIGPYFHGMRHFANGICNISHKNLIQYCIRIH